MEKRTQPPGVEDTTPAHYVVLLQIELSKSIQRGKRKVNKIRLVYDPSDHLEYTDDILHVRCLLQPTGEHEMHSIPHPVKWYSGEWVEIRNPFPKSKYTLYFHTEIDGDGMNPVIAYWQAVDGSIYARFHLDTGFELIECKIAES